MAQKDLLKLLTLIQKRMNNSKFFFILDEEEIINEIILDILLCLDWEGSIEREFRCNNGKIDVLMHNNNRPKVVLEAKNANKDVDEIVFKNQLWKYFDSVNVKLGILTNGYKWCFYLPRYRDKWRLKKFCELDIQNAPINHLYQNFVKILYKDNINSPRWSIMARNMAKKQDIDNSTMGITDRELINKIGKYRKRFSKLKPIEKNYLTELELEAMYRNLPKEYW